MKDKALTGIRWTTTSSILVAAIQLLQIAILSRLIEPAAFGLMAMSTVIVGFSQTFVDMGVSNAVVHRQNITDDQLNSLYWLNIMAGVTVYLIVMLISPIVSIFYREPRVANILFLLGTTFVIQSFGQQSLALLQKNLRFEVIAKIEVGTKLFGLLLSSILGYQGFGVYALIFATISTALVASVFYFFSALKIHKPKFHFNYSEISSFVNFGLYQMGEKTINYFNSQMDVIIIGRLLGSETLGIYSIAKQFVMRPTQIINPIISKVTFPIMVNLSEGDAAVKRIYLKTINYLSSINFAIYGGFFVLADEITLLLFGQKWIAAAPIIRILSLWAAIRSTGNPVGALILAKGRARLGFLWNLSLLFLVPISVVAGSKWGIFGVAWAQVISMILLMLPNWYFLVMPLSGARFIEYHAEILRPLVITAIAIISSMYLMNLSNTMAIRIFTAIVCGVVVLSILHCKWNQHFVRSLRDLVGGTFNNRA